MLARALTVAAAAILTACAHTRAGSVPPDIEMYLTTGDRTRLLTRQPSPDRVATTALPGTIIEVDPSREFQEVVGFGASLTDASAWLIQHKLDATQREALLQDLFGPEPGAGFSFTRVDMGASDFSLRHYSYDDMPAGERDSTLAHFSIEPDRAETIPILKRALAINPRLAIMASPWSAPGWMKSSESMIKGTLRDDAYAAYAEYFRRFIEAYASEGIPVAYLSIQNEPHFEPENYPGMRLEPPARARFIGQYLGPVLERANLRTRILDWDHNWDEPASPLGVLRDPVARGYVAGVAWHCYGGDVGAQSVVRDSFPDTDVFFTECSGGAWAPNFADNLVWQTKHLIIGATRNWARGVLQWNLALDESHGPHTGGCGDCRGVVTIDSRSGAVTRNEEYYSLAHASRFVKPGARRIASTTITDTLESVAFRNPEGSIALIVLNPGKAEHSFDVSAAAIHFRASLPPESVATFRWRP